jgi:integrase
MAKQLYESTKAAGVYKQHARDCGFAARADAFKDEHPKAKPAEAFKAATGAGKCKCKARYLASVYSVRDGKLIRKTFESQREAEVWRGEMRGAVDEGRVRAPRQITFSQASDALLEGMKDGTLETRSGHRYKPATIRRYELAVNLHLRPELGRAKLTDIDRDRIKRLVKSWRRAGMVPSSVRNNLDPLRVIIRDAIDDGNKGITIDPMAGMTLPQGSGRRERVADRDEARALVDALPDESQRALWACAFYGGLRRGELRALQWSDVDFEDGVIRVCRGWDDAEGAQATKSDAGERSVPLIRGLRAALRTHKLASGRGGADLVFGRTETLPFTSSTVGAQARKAWGWKQVLNPEKGSPRMVWVKAREDALQPIGLHEARHSAASFGHEAGLGDVELAAMLGHSDPRTTKSIYVHLFADSGTKTAAKLDAYHDAADAAS